MKEINVEKIMEEIRADIEKRGLAEDDLNFQDVMIQGDIFQIARFQDALKMANIYSNINLHNDVGGSGIKRFVKRVIRKCVRFYIQPMLEQQNEFNAHCVRTLNEMNLYISVCEENRRELEQKVDYLEKLINKD